MKSNTAEEKKVANIKKGDMVMVIAGGSKKEPLKGKTGRVLRVIGGEWVVLEGLKLVNRNQKQTKPGEKSAIIKKESPMHISNVMYYVEKLKKPVKVKYSTLADGKRVRGYMNPETKKFEQFE